MNFDRAAHRWIYAGIALAVALALSGCSGIAAVGSTVASGAEAIGTVVKDAINEEDKPAGPK